MRPFRKALAEYLALRRGLGTELKRCGWALHRFVEFLEREGASRITRELALRWATQPAGAQQATWALRLGYATTITRLLDVEALPVRRGGHPTYAVLKIDADARQLFKEFYAGIENRQQFGGNLAHMATWAGKLHGNDSAPEGDHKGLAVGIAKAGG